MTVKRKQTVTETSNATVLNGGSGGGGGAETSVGAAAVPSRATDHREPAGERMPQDMNRVWFLTGLGLVWLVGSIAAWRVGLAQDWQLVPAQVQSVIAPEAAFGGLLGGITASLTGCARHARDWRRSAEVWHVLRPFLGTLAGALSYLILFGVLVGVATGEVPDARQTPWAVALVVGFVVGYRDFYFVELLARVADVVLRRSSDRETEQDRNRVA